MELEVRRQKKNQKLKQANRIQTNNQKNRSRERDIKKKDEARKLN